MKELLPFSDQELHKSAAHNLIIFVEIMVEAYAALNDKSLYPNPPQPVQVPIASAAVRIVQMWLEGFSAICPKKVRYENASS